jgi:hypothetical protein
VRFAIDTSPNGNSFLFHFAMKRPKIAEVINILSAAAFIGLGLQRTESGLLRLIVTVLHDSTSSRMTFSGHGIERVHLSLVEPNRKLGFCHEKACPLIHCKPASQSALQSCT